jgi:hypothetical protein
MLPLTRQQKSQLGELARRGDPQGRSLLAGRGLLDLEIFAQRPDAAGAHVLTNQVTVLHHFDALDIRLELPVSSPV